MNEKLTKTAQTKTNSKVAGKDIEEPLHAAVGAQAKAASTKTDSKDTNKGMEEPSGTVAGASTANKPKRKVKKGALDQMVVVLDKVMGENKSFMEEFTGRATAAKVQYCVEDGRVPGSIGWAWSGGQRGDGERGEEKEEPYLLVTMDALGFAGLVHYSKLVS